MRKLFLFIVVVAALGWWGGDFVRSGGLERYLDRHPSPWLNPRLEYYWAVLLDLSNHPRSAKYRYRRVVEQYPGTPFAPRAWAALINVMDGSSSNDAVLEEANKFLERYPDDDKAEIIRKKIAFIQHGYN